MPGGALAVPDGSSIIKPLNTIIEFFSSRRHRVFASSDWHPSETTHFSKWPVHCVQNTKGAEFHPELKITPEVIVISKGYSKTEDGYSPFDGAYLRSDDWPFSLHTLLYRITDIVVGGLATDYCVKAACLDARKLGYNVYLLTDACRAVNLKPTDEAAALKEMKEAGVIFTTTDEVIRRLS